MAQHQLSERDNGGIVDARVGDSIELCLNEVASGGYRWTLQTDDGGVLEPFEHSHEFALRQVGGGSIARFHFRVASGGTRAIRLEYKRPWEDDREPLATYEVTIAAR